MPCPGQDVLLHEVAVVKHAVLAVASSVLGVPATSRSMSDEGVRV